VSRSIDERRTERAAWVRAATRRLLAAHGIADVEPRVVSTKANVIVALDGLQDSESGLVVRSPSRTDLLAASSPDRTRSPRRGLAMRFGYCTRRPGVFREPPGCRALAPWRGASSRFWS